MAEISMIVNSMLKQHLVERLGWELILSIRLLGATQERYENLAILHYSWKDSQGLEIWGTEKCLFLVIQPNQNLLLTPHFFFHQVVQQFPVTCCYNFLKCRILHNSVNNGLIHDQITPKCLNFYDLFIFFFGKLST